VVPSGNTAAVRGLTFSAMLLQFVLAGVLYVHFDPTAPGLQPRCEVVQRTPRPGGSDEAPSLSSACAVALLQLRTVIEARLHDPSLDPELFFPKPASRPVYLLVLTGIPNAIRRIGDMLRLAAGRADRPWMAPAERRPLIVEARAYLAGYAVVAAASVLAGTPIALLVWIAPWMIGQAFLRPYLLAEHTGCGVTRDCLENTRTTLTLALVRLFAWNMPYHSEHHAYPAVPFHALPRLHEQVRSRIEHLEPGYVAATVKVNRHLFGPRPGILRHPG